MKKFPHREWLVLLWLVAAVALLRWPSLEEPFDNDSASIAYHAHLIMHGEPLYGSHHPGHHLPAVFYTYVFAFFLFGEGAWAVKLLLIPWIAATAYFVYRFGSYLHSFTTGILAAILFVLLTSLVSLKGTTGQPELFANLPRLATVFLCVMFIKLKTKNPAFSLVGALGAVALLYKAIYLSPLIVACFLLAETAWIEGTWSKYWSRIAWMGMGFCLVFLPIIGYFASLGLMNRLLLTFPLGIGYIKGLGFIESTIAIMIAPIILFGAINPMLLIVSLASFITLIRRLFTSERRRLFARQHPKDMFNKSNNSSVTPMLGIILFFVMSTIEAGIAHPGFPNYNLLLVPHLGLLAACGISQLYDKCSIVLKYGAAWLAIGLMLIIIGTCIFANRSMYYHFFRYKLGSETYESFLHSTFSGRLFLDAKKLADYVKQRTSSDDFVYLWDDNMIFYNLVDRRAPTENLWPYYADLLGPRERIFVPRTKYIILGGSALKATTQWLYDQLRKGYKLETVINGREIYHRIQ